MGKGHYLGGGSLIGFGSISNAKGRRGGIGVSGAALREQRRVAEKWQKRKLVAQVKANEEILKRNGEHWAAEKGRAHYDNLVKASRVKVSSLASALALALSVNEIND
jgi:hypothetical protein